MYRFAYVFTYVRLFYRAFSFATYERNLAVAFSVVNYVRSHPFSRHRTSLFSPTLGILSGGGGEGALRVLFVHGELLVRLPELLARE